MNTRKGTSNHRKGTGNEHPAQEDRQEIKTISQEENAVTYVPFWTRVRWEGVSCLRKGHAADEIAQKLLNLLIRHAAVRVGQAASKTRDGGTENGGEEAGRKDSGA